jgi:hypothetical protein
MRLIVFTGTAALVAGLVVSAPASAQDRQSRALDPGVPLRMELTLCADDADRDCIEALGLVTNTGFSPGEIISAGDPIVEGPVERGGTQSGPITGTTVTRLETWRIPGLKTESGLDTIDPFISITTPGLKWYDAGANYEYDVISQVVLEVGTGRGTDVRATPACDEERGTCVRPEQISPDQILRAVIRTSWFQPAWARSHLGGTILRVEPLTDGGSRITVEGRALNSPGFFFGGGRDPRPERREDFDFYDYRWTVYMLDANDPNFPERCAQHGFPLISGNQWGSGTPNWDSRTQSMDLSMSAPHHDPAGKAFRGHYEALIPAAYAKCLWQTDPKRLQSRLMVEVTSEDGEDKAATTAIAFRNGSVRIVARNFTFSSPTVTVKPKKKRR